MSPFVGPVAYNVRVDWVLDAGDFVTHGEQGFQSYTEAEDWVLAAWRQGRVSDWTMTGEIPASAQWMCLHYGG